MGNPYGEQQIMVTNDSAPSSIHRRRRASRRRGEPARPRRRRRRCAGRPNAAPPRGHNAAWASLAPTWSCRSRGARIDERSGLCCVQLCTVVYSSVQFCTVLYSCVQVCTVLYSSVQFCTVVGARPARPRPGRGSRERTSNTSDVSSRGTLQPSPERDARAPWCRSPG
jgi:hypothetical protein